MYKSFFVLINDYIFSLGKHVTFDVILPIILGSICGVLIWNDLLFLKRDFISNILSVLGIIAGFSVTAIAVLTSTENETINKLKSKDTGITIDGNEVSVFKRFYILISYSVLASFFAILINIIGYLVPWNIFPESLTIILKTLNLIFIFHIFFLNIRNISSLYFIYFNDTNKL